MNEEVIHPGQIIRKEILEKYGLGITEASHILGVWRTTLSKIVNYRAGISVEMAVRLSKAFYGTPEYWLTLQLNYHLKEAREVALSLQMGKFDPDKVYKTGSDKYEEVI
jgi:addiction module HigA family antidote